MTGRKRNKKMNYRAKLIPVVEQMMYVSGETAEPSVETTSIIEDIVRQQVIELVKFGPTIGPKHQCF
jgi:transcription initiation protein SPT3